MVSVLIAFLFLSGFALSVCAMITTIASRRERIVALLGQAVAPVPAGFTVRGSPVRVVQPVPARSRGALAARLRAHA